MFRSISVSAIVGLAVFGGPMVTAFAQDAKPTIEAKTVGAIPNLTGIGDQVLFGGQPTAEDFKALADKGVKVIVNLRTEPEMAQVGFDEKALAEKNGITYVHAPMGREGASPSVLESVFKALDASKEQPVLVHCGSSNRVGSVWAMYRGAKQGVAEDAAIEEGKKAGLRAAALEEAARAYIKDNAKKE